MGDGVSLDRNPPREGDEPPRQEKGGWGPLAAAITVFIVRARWDRRWEGAHGPLSQAAPVVQ